MFGKAAAIVSKSGYGRRRAVARPEGMENEKKEHRGHREREHREYKEEVAD
jgi:hypothetical protein